jgi:hypothetical protein
MIMAKVKTSALRELDTKPKLIPRRSVFMASCGIIGQRGQLALNVPYFLFCIIRQLKGIQNTENRVPPCLKIEAN